MKKVTASLPLYKSCAVILRQQILDGKWEQGEKLPSENELTAYFRASRITVRQAMQVLEHEGLITKKQGKGTFVTYKTSEQDLLGIHDFAKRSHLRGKNPSFIIENNQIIESNNLLCRNMNIDQGENVYLIKRVKLENEEPLMYERLFLPCKYAPSLTIHDLSQYWLSEILEKRFQLPVTKVKQTIEPIIIGEEEAKKLNVAPQSLGLLIDRLSWSKDKVVLFTRSIIRGDLAKYCIEIGEQKD
ncbi:GntR family transcriptional regulator [Sutcliffiella cohnii]|uniref:GntR family transcriptional regulator n=1 Tax=Sutcliffiella cohnii TaxID=33932 RepID=UPI002E220D44|nr:GntR family transcriptional regulator [Sutcliffiella cohnii]